MTDTTLVLLRHGESIGNRDGIFTGSLDVPLTEHGRLEARRAGELLRAAEVTPDVILTSTMRRARQTVAALAATGLLPVAPPVLTILDPRLNERNYGALTGRTKHSVLAEAGEAQYREWRRSFDAAPPPMSPAQRTTILRQSAPGSDRLGLTESLRDVVDRVGRVVTGRIRPALDAGRSVLVVAHGNSLRAICTVLDRLSPAAVSALNLPTGFPLLYRFDDEGRPVVPGGLYLDPVNAATAADLIRQEGGT